MGCFHHASAFLYAFDREFYRKTALNFSLCSKAPRQSLLVRDDRDTIHSGVCLTRPLKQPISRIDRLDFRG